MICNFSVPHLEQPRVVDEQKNEESDSEVGRDWCGDGSKWGIIRIYYIIPAGFLMCCGSLDCKTSDV